MNKIFYTRWVKAGLIVSLVLVNIYLFFLITPHFKPLWHLLRTIAIPFITALIFAYLLNPIVEKLAAWGLKRVWAILLLYILLFGGLGTLIWYATPIFIQQIKTLAGQMPVIEHTLYHWFYTMDYHIERLPQGIHQGIDDAIGSVERSIRKGMRNVLETSGAWIGNSLILAVIPFLAFYFLLDMELFQKGLHRVVPHKYKTAVRMLFKDIDHSLGEYIRGQMLISVIVGSLVFVSYHLIRLPNALFLAVFAAISNIIPYFGPFLGAAPAVVVSLMSAPHLLVWVIVLNVLIQVIEGNVLAPWIMGKRLRIHPVVIILILLVGAEIGGILGLILVVPFYVVLKVIVVHSIAHYRALKRDEVHTSDS